MGTLIEFREVCKYYQMGDTTVKAAQLAVKQINEQGGLLGRQVELVVYDDQASQIGRAHV